MPNENLEDLGFEKNPDFDLAQYRFLLTLPEYASDQKIHAKIREKVKKNCMAPWYEVLCRQMGWQLDVDFYKPLRRANQTEIQKLKDAINDAELNLGETEIREAYLKKAEYYCRIGDKFFTVDTYRITYIKSSSTGQKLDVIFHLIRAAYFFSLNLLLTRSIAEANTLIEQGGDWDRRNRLKVYTALYYLTYRYFKHAAKLFLDTVSTFTSYELFDYKTFICYTVYLSLISLPRHELREKVINKSEILEVLHGEPVVKGLIHSLYNCSYANFFKNLAETEVVLKKDYFFHRHYHYYIRKMKIIAYSQLLQSYSSLTLKYMAESFGVTVTYIEKDLQEFITAGRLNCKIDKVSGVVETNRPNLRNSQFNLVIKHGDLLLTRLQKLSRVIDV